MSKPDYQSVSKSATGEVVARNVTNTFHFDVSLSVIQKEKKKYIVNHVSDVVQSGQMLAIMGPSGAGKTSLLRVLTMEAIGGHSEGTVTINGLPLTSALFKSKCGLVAQEDYHWAFLTCRETIAYAADLLLPHASSQEKATQVSHMITKMGLDSCADTIVGNAFKHGLSGGQKRRLSLAVVLMKKLEIIFLDEPTSGLDAAAAAGIMEFLRDLTRAEQLVTIFTVHQPSTNIYNSFDRVMLLSKGRTAFVGPKDDVPGYLSLIKRPLPAQTNPAEFMLDIVNTDFTDDVEVERILTAWVQDGQPAHRARNDVILQSSFKDNAHLLKPAAQASVFAQSFIMLRRHALLAMRDPLIYLGRVVMFFFVCIFFAIIYIEARKLDQKQALPHFWLGIWCISVPSNAGVIAVYVFNTEFFTIKKEVKNGMVQTLPYLLANSLLQIPVMFLFAIMSISVQEYGMINYNGKHYGQMMLLFALTMYCFESIAQLLAVVFTNPLLGMLQFVNVWFSTFLFCGLFLPIKSIPWPFQIFSYILPFRYTLRSMAYQEYKGTTWSGAELCDPLTDVLCQPEGFKCAPGATYCYGRTGEQILHTLHKSFDLISPKDYFATDVGILIAIAVVAKLFFIVFMSMKATTESTLHQPSDDVSVAQRQKQQVLKASSSEEGKSQAVELSPV